MKKLETIRLIIDELRPADAPFVLAILNDEDFINYVADRGIRTLEQAEAYINEHIIASYKKHDFGMGAVRLKDGGEIIGMCGLVNRDSLPDVDLGYGFLPAARGQGYALEAATAIVKMAREVYGLSRLAAIIHPANGASRSLASKLGMHLDSMIRLAPDENETCLYLWVGLNHPQHCAPAHRPDCQKTGRYIR